MLAPWKKSYDKSWQHVEKQRHHFANKVAKFRIVNAIVFLVVMYGCESWTIKRTESWRSDAFELWCWRRPLIIPWTARRSDQSIPKDSNPDYSLEGLLLKLNHQYFGHLIQRADSLEKTLIRERLKVKEKGATEHEMARYYHGLKGHESDQTLGDSEGQGSLASYSWRGRKELKMT